MNAWVGISAFKEMKERPNSGRGPERKGCCFYGIFLCLAVPNLMPLGHTQKIKGKAEKEILMHNNAHQ